MNLILMILKNAVFTLLILPIVIFGQQRLYKEEKQLKLKGAIFAWIVVIVLLTLKEYYNL